MSSSPASHCGSPNTLMCMDISSYLSSPIHHGYLRSAGSRGFYLFEELVALHTVLPMYFEVQSNDEGRQHPLLPETTYGAPITGSVLDGSNGCMVVSLTVFQHRALPLPFWREMACSSLRIHVARTSAPHLSGTTTSSLLPPRIGMASRASYIELSGFETTEIVPGYFLTDCGDISTLDLSPLLNVKIIRDYFLGCCSHLLTLDLSPLKAVTSIGDGFLHGCAALSHLDFTGCDGIETIGLGFLASCTSLEAINLSSLCRITAIEASFMKGCSSLTAIDLAPFTRVTRIGTKFLSGCKSLTKLDLSPLSQELASLDHLFLDRCLGITSLDVSPLLRNISRVEITRAIGTDLAASIEIQW